jgi:uncharacterized membrane protein (UPF0127 family)
VLGKDSEPLAPRLSGLPRTDVAGRRVPVASTRRARLLGLALLGREAAGPGLLLPRCRSVHTFGMRFELDLVFLDHDLAPVSTRRAVPSRRIAVERRARAVLELPVGALGGGR